MAKSESSRKIQKLVLDSDMAAAAQQLLLLSDAQEDRDSNSIMTSSIDDQEEIDQRSRNEIARQKKIEEIFGKGEGVYRPTKRKYRSLAKIYQATKPACR